MVQTYSGDQYVESRHYLNGESFKFIEQPKEFYDAHNLQRFLIEQNPHDQKMIYKSRLSKNVTQLGAHFDSTVVKTNEN